VAGGALHRRMFAGERELGFVVIELGAQPIGCRVAQGAILREPRRDMVRRGCSLIFLEVATVAGRG